jgi:nuclear GTP-binding protein
MRAPAKKASKRQPLNKQHKIEKRVKQHHRKLKKEAKKMKALGIYKGKNSKSDDRLPNLYPFKKKIIESLERKKKNVENERKAKLLRDKEDQSALDEMTIIEANNRSVVYESQYKVEEEKYDAHDGSNHNRKFYRELNQVLTASDIVLEVLDARDPMGCRNKELEAKILGMPGDKRIILVLNKIDLVPQQITQKWLNILRKEFPTILFKANTQNQQSHLSSNKIFNNSLNDKEELIGDLLDSSKALGADNLLQLIKNYSRDDKIKHAVSVGLIGYPNVGKSSVINSLKRSKAVSVSSVPGHTKSMQEVYIDSKVKLLDCPGVIFANADEKTLVLKNIIKVGDVKDPVGPMEDILAKINKSQILIQYEIADFSTTVEFLTNVAFRRGKLGKGGIPDIEGAARLVLQDWNAGRIQYFTMPPDEDMGSIME